MKKELEEELDREYRRNDLSLKTVMNNEIEAEVYRMVTKVSFR